MYQKQFIVNEMEHNVKKQIDAQIISDHLRG